MSRWRWPGGADRARHRVAVAATAALLFGAPFAASAQTLAESQPGAGRTFHVAMVLPRTEGQIERGFEEYFAKRGVLLQTTVVTYSGRSTDQPALIAQLRRLKPDLICTAGSPSTLAVAGSAGSDPERHIHDIPVVFTSVADPVAAGLVRDAARHRRNLTGVTPLAPLAIQMNAIRAYRPFRAIGYLYDGTRPSTLAIRDGLQALAAKHGIALLAEQVPLAPGGTIDSDAIPGAVAGLKEKGADFLYIGPETFLSTALQDQVAHAALASGLPSFAAIESTVADSGALFGLFSPQADIGRLAAFKAMRILTEQVAPADEPIESLQNFSLLINMRTARSLEAFPPLLLLDIAEVVPDARNATSEPQRTLSAR